MKKLLIILVILLWSSLSWGAAVTYYVDNCVETGDDAHAGTSTAEPWLTIHQVNSHSSLNPGDSVLFRAGCTWREQLTVPSSDIGIWQQMGTNGTWVTSAL